MRPLIAVINERPAKCRSGTPDKSKPLDALVDSDQKYTAHQKNESQSRANQLPSFRKKKVVVNLAVLDIVAMPLLAFSHRHNSFGAAGESFVVTSENFWGRKRSREFQLRANDLLDHPEDSPSRSAFDCLLLRFGTRCYDRIGRWRFWSRHVSCGRLTTLFQPFSDAPLPSASGPLGVWSSRGPNDNAVFPLAKRQYNRSTRTRADQSDCHASSWGGLRPNLAAREMPSSVPSVYKLGLHRGSSKRGVNLKAKGRTLDGPTARSRSHLIPPTSRLIPVSNTQSEHYPPAMPDCD